jgi:hypothetical protein
MRPRNLPLLLGAWLALVASVASAPSFARDEPPPKTRPGPSASAPAAVSPPPSARPLEPTEEAAPLPPGHPMVAPDSEDDGEEPREPAPHPAAPGMFQPPPDTSEEDPSLPPGTLTVDVRDADNRPVPNAPLVLTTLHQSVAKGQSKETRAVPADAAGHLRLDHLEIGSSVSYWVKDQVDRATFASAPAQMGGVRGVHQVLHVYPVTHSLETALIVTQAVIYFEVKDDRVQVEQAVTLFNFGKTAWFPDDLVVTLPQGFTALTSQAQMSDQGVDSVDGKGARIRGTFAPGRHDLDFRWQLPYDGESTLSVDVNLPPHVAIMRVMAAAGAKTTLDVTGFPAAERRTDRQGQRILVTEKQVRRDAPLTAVHVVVSGLLTSGPGKYVATGLAALTLALGLVLGVGKRGHGADAPKGARALLLDEMLDLERAKERGEIGPKTYERARRELVDAIARTLAPEA